MASEGAESKRRTECPPTPHKSFAYTANLTTEYHKHISCRYTTFLGPCEAVGSLGCFCHWPLFDALPLACPYPIVATYVYQNRLTVPALVLMAFRGIALGSIVIYELVPWQ